LKHRCWWNPTIWATWYMCHISRLVDYKAVEHLNEHRSAMNILNSKNNEIPEGPMKMLEPFTNDRFPPGAKNQKGSLMGVERKSQCQVNRRISDTLFGLQEDSFIADLEDSMARENTLIMELEEVQMKLKRVTSEKRLIRADALLVSEENDKLRAELQKAVALKVDFEAEKKILSDKLEKALCAIGEKDKEAQASLMEQNVGESWSAEDYEVAIEALRKGVKNDIKMISHEKEVLEKMMRRLEEEAEEAREMARVAVQQNKTLMRVIKCCSACSTKNETILAEEKHNYEKKQDLVQKLLQKNASPDADDKNSFEKNSENSEQKVNVCGLSGRRQSFVNLRETIVKMGDKKEDRGRKLSAGAQFWGNRRSSDNLAHRNNDSTGSKSRNSNETPRCLKVGLSWHGGRKQAEQEIKSILLPAQAYVDPTRGATSNFYHEQRDTTSMANAQWEQDQVKPSNSHLINSRQDRFLLKGINRPISGAQCGSTGMKFAELSWHGGRNSSKQDMVSLVANSSPNVGTAWKSNETKHIPISSMSNAQWGDTKELYSDLNDFGWKQLANVKDLDNSNVGRNVGVSCRGERSNEEHIAFGAPSNRWTRCQQDDQFSHGIVRQRDGTAANNMVREDNATASNFPIQTIGVDTIQVCDEDLEELTLPLDLAESKDVKGQRGQNDKSSNALGRRRFFSPRALQQHVPAQKKST